MEATLCVELRGRCEHQWGNRELGDLGLNVAYLNSQLLIDRLLGRNRFGDDVGTAVVGIAAVGISIVVCAGRGFFGGLLLRFLQLLP